MNMNMRNSGIMLSALLSLMVLTPARASTVDYVLDHSNSFKDVTDYLMVSISDDNAGQLDFQVKTLEMLEDMAGGNYGIQSFGLNFMGLSADLSIDDFLLPDGWRVQFNKGMSEAGRFDARIMGTGRTRLDPLEFSVRGLSLDNIEAGFAAHVAGFMETGGSPGSAFFYGDTLVPPAAIPLPAAIWLFGSGLLGLAGVARRRRHLY